MRASNFIHRNATRFRHLAYRIRRLFKRTDHMDAAYSELVGRHCKDASGEFVHILLRKRRP